MRLRPILGVVIGTGAGVALGWVAQSCGST